MATIVFNSELATGISYSSAVPGLSQYLQSITKLLISMLSVTTEPGLADCNLLETGKATDPCLSVAHLLHSDFYEVRLLVLEATLRWQKQMSCQHTIEGEGKNLLSLLSGLEEILLGIAVKEKHSECFCKVLEVLCGMDFRSLLLKTEDAIRMNPMDFLHWIMNIADTSDSIEIQSVSLKFASKLIVHFVQNWQEEVKSETKLWIQIVTYCCEDEQQTDLSLAAADALVTVAPFFLISQNLLLGLPDTLLLWKCVTHLLQSEEQIVRDAAAGVIRVALTQGTIFKKKEALVSPLVILIVVGFQAQLESLSWKAADIVRPLLPAAVLRLISSVLSEDISAG
uniref:Uncharacterized protein n=1 Tax=Sphaerodactylus townsendi TaxID=933632 RepID=A0ACB8G9T3_9SAUR